MMNKTILIQNLPPTLEVSWHNTVSVDLLINWSRNVIALFSFSLYGQERTKDSITVHWHQSWAQLLWKVASIQGIAFGFFKQ